MSDLHSRILAIPGGARALAAARLRQDVLRALRQALADARMTQQDLARRLGVRKSAVNRVFQGDGNVQLNTIAEYMHELGMEVRIDVSRAGTRDHVRSVTIERIHFRAEWEGSFARSAVIDKRPASNTRRGSRPATTAAHGGMTWRRSEDLAGAA